MRNLIISLLMIICFGININAQTNYKEKFCNKLCIGSIATYGTGFALDANSSWNKLEKNKIFIGNNGKFSFSKYSLYHSGLIGITFITQKKYPLASSIIRFGIGGWLIYNASKNYRYSPNQKIRCCILPLVDGSFGR